MRTLGVLCALPCLFLAQLMALPALAAAKKGVSEISEPGEPPKYYYWNEMSGKVQWDDPGDVPYEDETGNKYWLKDNSERVTGNPEAHKYAWVEGYSDEQGRPYFFNQETQESTWERPEDLAWRRVPYVGSDEL